MKRGVLILLCFSALFYAALLSRFYVGYFNDDAVYILASQSLLKGSYSQHLNNLPMTYFMPGFPLALAPLSALAAPYWGFLKLIAFFSTILSVLLLWKLTQPWLSEPQRMAVVVLWALNPVVVGFSGTVLAEPFFILLCLAAFYALQQAFKSTDRSLWIWVAFASGWAALTRPHGFLLSLAIGTALLLKKRFRESFALTLLSLLPVSLFFLRNFLLTQQATGYAVNWKSIVSDVASPQGAHLLVENAWNVLRTLLLQNLFPSFWDAWIPLPGLWNGLLGLLVAGTLIWGWGILLKKQADVALLAITLFVPAFLFVQMVWLAVDVRFCLPLVPYLLIFLVAGITSVKPRVAYARGWKGFWMIGFSIVYIAGWGFAIHHTFIAPGDHHAPRRTFSWIRDHIPSDAKLVTTSATAFTLHTGHRAIHRPPPGDAQEMRYWMLRENAPYLVILPMRLLNLKEPGRESPQALWLRAGQQVATAPQEFKLIHEDREEQTRIYQAVDDPTFVQAYALFREAQRAASLGEFAEARKKARSALALDTRLQKARDLLAGLSR